MTHAVREATGDDADDVVRLLDAAMLSVDRERVRRRAAMGCVLVAIVRGHNRAERQAAVDADSAPDGRVVGACVLAGSDPDPDPDPDRGSGPESPPTEIEHVAVHRSRRGRGIGTALVGDAATRTDGPLVARFRPSVEPFYESLGFATDAPGGNGSDSGSGRLRGTLR